MTYRVIQWGAGANGSALIRGVAAHADLELVACRVYDPAKDGVDAGELAGVAPGRAVYDGPSADHRHPCGRRAVLPPSAARPD